MEPRRSGNHDVSYNFLGWSTNRNAIHPIYFPREFHTFNNSVTLFAVWEEIRRHHNLTSGYLLDTEIWLGWVTVISGWVNVVPYADINLDKGEVVIVVRAYEFTNRMQGRLLDEKEFSLQPMAGQLTDGQIWMQLDVRPFTGNVLITAFKKSGSDDGFFMAGGFIQAV
jgi:hypothetical protein